MEENVTTIEAPKKRPTFLTVLCILSFIGSGGFGLLAPIYEYATFESTYQTTYEQMSTGLENMSDAGMDSGFMYEFTENNLIILEKKSQDLGTITGATCFFALLSLIGVFLMFKLKRNGFYLYLVANLFALLVPLALIDFDATMFLTMIGGGFTVLFIILYALNLKHME
ncbi:hypothetical protein [Labilibaculum antarcticum]|uniref:Uncharacterized protein n=1 Tax=Labilibaculum antarcticum TaxID=1717717 RepID=A0A1Y1CFS5_9BACT|nr:hypothetical protein [Labilibaculum antarcticum]BAX79236.1 hypothetical protein ALGA_0847 [Labilibaculum antarcticum]